MEITIDDVKKLIDSEADFLFLDCRQESEYETASIEGATLLPMGEIAQRVEELEEHKQRQIVIHCHHGGRSLRVAQWLRQQGFEHAQSMMGGIDGWSQQIDESIPRY